MSSWVKQRVVFQPARSRVRVGLLRDRVRVGSEKDLLALMGFLSDRA
jgi:hypothetical protein